MLTSNTAFPSFILCIFAVHTSFKVPQEHSTDNTLASPNRVSFRVSFKSRRDAHCLQRICFASSFKSTILKPSLQVNGFMSSTFSLDAAGISQLMLGSAILGRRSRRRTLLPKFLHAYSHVWYCTTQSNNLVFQRNVLNCVCFSSYRCMYINLCKTTEKSS